MKSAGYADKAAVVTLTRYAELARLWTKTRAALIVLVVVASGACATGGGVPRPFPGAAIPPGTGGAPNDRVETPPERVEAPVEPVAPGTPGTVVATALEFRGVPYVFGGTDPTGFDCSGLVQYVFAQHGTQLPREARDQSRIGRRVDVNEVQAGDLVFFQTVTRGASHVGLAIGGHQFVHAPSSRGVVRVERYDSSYWASRFVGARRLVNAALVTSRGLPGAVRSSQ